MGINPVVNPFFRSPWSFAHLIFFFRLEGYVMTKKICGGVYMVAGGSLSGSNDAAAYLVSGDSQVLIDCGAQPSSGSKILENIKGEKIDPGEISHLVLTHGHVDHIGGATTVLDATKCQLVCHEQDAQAIETGDPSRTASDWYGIDLPELHVDKVLKGDSGTLAGLKWVHTPGHTPGSIVLIFESPDGRVLFGQDIHGPFSPSFHSNKDQWAKSMETLLAWNADILCEGHYGIFYGKNEVNDFIKSHLRTNGYL